MLRKRSPTIRWVNLIWVYSVSVIRAGGQTVNGVPSISHSSIFNFHQTSQTFHLFIIYVQHVSRSHQSEFHRIHTGSNTLTVHIRRVCILVLNIRSIFLTLQISFNNSLTIDEVVSQNTSPAGKSVLVCPLLAFQAGFFRLQWVQQKTNYSSHQAWFIGGTIMTADLTRILREVELSLH